MSGPLFIPVGDSDGMHGYVRTKDFMNWVEEVANNQLCQPVALGDNTTNEPIICTVWTLDINLEPWSATTSAGLTTPGMTAGRSSSSFTRGSG